MNSKIKAIREALVSVLQQLRTVDGYSIDVLEKNVFSSYSDPDFTNTEDKHYPKVVVILESGSSSKLPGNRAKKIAYFWIIFVVKKFSKTDKEPSDKIEAIVDDVDLLLMRNDTLIGTVEDATLREYQKDAGDIAPEGAAVFRVECEYFQQF